MSKINMIKSIKELHSKTIVLLESGAFCEAYGKDAYILSYLFNYQIIQKGQYGIPKVGFSKNTIPRVLAELENKKVDYLMLNVRNNYYEDNKCKNGNLNTYEKIYEKACIYIKKRRRIDEISNILIKQINLLEFENRIKSIKEILNEGRKV